MGWREGHWPAAGGPHRSQPAVTPGMPRASLAGWQRQDDGQPPVVLGCDDFNLPSLPLESPDGTTAPFWFLAESLGTTGMRHPELGRSPRPHSHGHFGAACPGSALCGLCDGPGLSLVCRSSLWSKPGFP